MPIMYKVKQEVINTYNKNDQLVGINFLYENKDEDTKYIYDIKLNDDLSLKSLKINDSEHRIKEYKNNTEYDHKGRVIFTFIGPDENNYTIFNETVYDDENNIKIDLKTTLNVYVFSDNDLSMLYSNDLNRTIEITCYNKDNSMRYNIKQIFDYITKIKHYTTMRYIDPKEKDAIIFEDISDTMYEIVKNKQEKDGTEHSRYNYKNTCDGCSSYIQQDFFMKHKTINRSKKNIYRKRIDLDMKTNKVEVYSELFSEYSEASGNLIYQKLIDYINKIVVEKSIRYNDNNSVIYTIITVKDLKKKDNQ